MSTLSSSTQSKITSALIGQSSKLEKMTSLSNNRSQPFVPGNDQNNNGGLERQKSQLGIVQQNSIKSSSNIQIGSSKDLQNSVKKSGGVLSNNYCIENIVDNISLARGGRLIYNGQVRKEFTADTISRSPDVLRLTKTQFAKL
jgi:hypothetical protein